MRIKIIITVLAAVTVGVAVAEQGIISMNFCADANNTDQAIDVGETYGVPVLGTVVGNWVNGSYSPGPMLWDDGSTNTVGMSLRATGGFQNPSAGLVNTVLYNGPMSWGAGVGFSIYGMANEFQEGYSVIVYLSGHVWAGNTYITDGTTTNYWITPNPAITNLIQTTDTTGVGMPANYAVFSNLNANALTFDMLGVAGNGQCIAGFQIVGEKGSFRVPAPEGLIIGWDSGIGLNGDYRMDDAKGNLYGGPWPENAFAGSLDGTFGTRPGATDAFTMSSVMNNTAPGSSDTMIPSVGWTNAVPVRLDSMHFDIGRETNSFDTITLYQVVGGGTNQVYTQSGLPITGSSGDFTDIDISLTNLPDRVLADGQTLNFLLVGSNAISNDANMYLDNTAFYGEMITHYEGWAYNYGDIGTSADDPDEDGLANLGEYAFGGNPVNGNNRGYILSSGAAVSSGGTNYIEYVYARRTTQGTIPLSYAVVTRPNMVDGDWAYSTDVIEEVGTGILVTNNFESVTNWIPTAGKSSEFLNVEVSE